VWAGRRLFVGEDFAGLGDVLFDEGDAVGPVAAGLVGVGDAGGVEALGLGEMVEEDFEVLLGSGAGHRGILIRFPCKWVVGAPPVRKRRVRMGHPSGLGWVQKVGDGWVTRQRAKRVDLWIMRAVIWCGRENVYSKGARIQRSWCGVSDSVFALLPSKDRK